MGELIIYTTIAAPHMKNTKIWFLRVEMRSTSKRMIWFTEAVLVLFQQTDGLLFIWKTIWVRCGWWCACAGYAVDRLCRPIAYCGWVCVCSRSLARQCTRRITACLLLARSRRIRSLQCMMFTLYQNKKSKNESVSTCANVLSELNKRLGDLCVGVCACIASPLVPFIGGSNQYTAVLIDFILKSAATMLIFIFYG